ncbi:PTP-ER [Drosophila busckii]|uniref:protein-tyrosine-phosphatase n=2 Tax=Drosophila busckii TaxID=30019 RepID=A0A0M4EAC7_DROBS|nr:PTP-ER [Drosophila busckii]
MDKLKNNNKENAVIASIECPCPYASAVDTDVDVESNKSTPTPYFTPLEYLQTSFEFPSPTTTKATATATSGAASTGVWEEETATAYTPKHFTIAHTHGYAHGKQPQSPTTLNRKLKRFSLYDRRSCSPQDATGRIVANKENTIPKHFSVDNDQDNLYLSKSEHNSPTILFRDESTSSINLNTTTAAAAVTATATTTTTPQAQLNYSPKLLASINNLNLQHSPLSIINSAGYKHGNFFRFPEIDQAATVLPTPLDNQPINQQVSEYQQDGRRNRKNKNNLTIRITDTQQQQPPLSPAPLSKPKTPTIKCTKEKARSLDSAANESELSIVVQHIQESRDVSLGTTVPIQTSSSNSLSKLDTTQSLYSRRSNRRKSPGLNNSDWLMYQRKQHAYQSSLESEVQLKSASSVDSKFTLGANLAPRSAHKHNPLLHASSTNLKTLPECITLVEFTPNSATSSIESPYKQKSMDLPQAKHMNSSMNLLQRRGSNHSLTLNLHSSCSNLMSSALSVSNYSLGSASNSKSSCNLEQQKPTASHQLQLQVTVAGGSVSGSGSSGIQSQRQGLFRRRGSNHSISLKNHTTNSCGELNAMATPKRGLLERRGSNQSLTLNMSSQPQETLQLEQPKLTVCQCGASGTAQSPHQRKFFSTENLHSNRTTSISGSSQYLGFKPPICFGSATDLQPSDDLASNSSVRSVRTEAGGVVCSCASGGGAIRNIMTRPLSPQTTSEEFKIYLASIQLLQSASNPLNQYQLIKLNQVFDHSYKANVEQPPVLVLGRGEGDTPTLQQQHVQQQQQPAPSSEDSELLAIYQAIVKRIVIPFPQLDGDEQKRIFRELHKEFWDLPLNHQEKPMVFGSQTKNRYKTILPNEHSRVLLESEVSGLQQLELDQAELREEPVSTLSAQDEMPYINANYIKGPDYVSKCYVATQGPLPNTIFEFWLMIYQNTQRYIRRCQDGGSSPHVDKSHILQQYYQKIVMLTNFTECSRQKCAIYFPIELNEIFSVSARDEVFELDALARDYFEPHLQPHATQIDSLEAPSELQPDRERACGEHIIVDTLKVTLAETVRSCLPAQGSFFLVKNVGIVRRNGYSVRKLVLLYCMSVPQQRLVYYLQKICCYHYWYPDWPDHHSPRDINTLLDTCLHVLNLGKCESEFDNYDDKRSVRNAHLFAQRLDIYKQDIFNAVQPLPVIHCSAGIGRTGCFTAILNAVRQLRQSLAYSLTGMLSKTLTMSDVLEAEAEAEGTLHLVEDTDSSFSCNTLHHIRHIVQSSNTISFDMLPKMPDIFVDILGIVCNLRLQRGGMVQNSEQYELIHRAIGLYLKRTLALRRF